MGHWREEKQGILYTAASYLLWGVLPLYWKLLEARPALEILAHRIVWSFVFMAILLAATGQLGAFRRELRAMRRRPAKATGDRRCCRAHQRQLVCLHMGGESSSCR